KILFFLLPVTALHVNAQETDTIAVQAPDTIIAEEREQIRVYGGFESNAQWYLNDKGRVLRRPEDPVRSNNYFLINYQYGKWLAGMQIEAYEPNALLNYNPGFKGGGLGLAFLTYKSEKFDATAGYFYEQFGSGLLLRAWEDRALGINTA